MENLSRFSYSRPIIITQQTNQQKRRIENTRPTVILSICSWCFLRWLKQRHRLYWCWRMISCFVVWPRHGWMLDEEGRTRRNRKKEKEWPDQQPELHPADCGLGGGGGGGRKKSRHQFIHHSTFLYRKGSRRGTSQHKFLSFSYCGGGWDNRNVQWMRME